MEQNKSVGELSIRNLLLSQIGVLEGLINQTNIDRNRVVVKEINWIFLDFSSSLLKFIYKIYISTPCLFGSEPGICAGLPENLD